MSTSSSDRSLLRMAALNARFGGRHSDLESPRVTPSDERPARVLSDRGHQALVYIGRLLGEILACCARVLPASVDEALRSEGRST